MVTIKIKSKTAVILNGSARHNGNTSTLVGWLQEALQKNAWKTITHNLYALNFKGCIHCDCCKKVEDKHGCILKDDLDNVLNSIHEVELIAIVSPVYCWSTSGCMSTALDRFYAFLKEEHKSLIAEKKILGAFTCGGDAFDGTDLCVSMLKQISTCFSAKYAGTIAATDCTTPDEFLTRHDLKTELFAKVENL